MKRAVLSMLTFLATLCTGALTWLAGRALFLAGNDLTAAVGVTMMRLGPPVVGFVGGCVILHTLWMDTDR